MSEHATDPVPAHVDEPATDTGPAHEPVQDALEAGGADEFEPIFQALEDFQVRVNTLEETIGQWPPGGKWFLPGLDAAETVKLLSDVSFFTAWLNETITRYLPSEYRLLPCWYKHPPVVEMLIAVMVNHQSAYARKTTKPSPALVSFFTQSLFPILHRIKEMRLCANCTVREHVEVTEHTSGPTWRPDHPGIQDWINAAGAAAHEASADLAGTVFVPVAQIHSELYGSVKRFLHHERATAPSQERSD